MLQLELLECELGERGGLDAVVNAADTELNFAGAVDLVLAHFGGPDLVREAEALGPIDLGTGVCTGPGALPTTRVIHVAVTGFRLQDLTSDLREGSLTSEAILKNATRAALALAEKNGCAALAFPALARGVLGFPPEEGARPMLEALWEYVLAQPTTCVKKVELVLLPEETEHFVNARRALAERERTALEAQALAERDAQAARERVEQEERERRAQAEREELERLARERAAREKAEWLRQERERAERERIERERVERDRERAERERMEWERAERERVERERMEWERAEAARMERERMEWERAQREQAQLEAAARDLVARERAERERAAEGPAGPLGRGARLGGARPPGPSRPTLVETMTDPSAAGNPAPGNRASTPAEGPPGPPPRRRSLADEKTHIVRDGAAGATPPRKVSTPARPTMVEQPGPAKPSPSVAPPAPRRPFVEEKTHIVRDDAAVASKPAAPAAPRRPFLEEKTQILRDATAGATSLPGQPAAPAKPAAPAALHAGAPARRPARVGAGPLIRDDDDFAEVTEVPVELDAELEEDEGLPSDGPTITGRS